MRIEEFYPDWMWMWVAGTYMAFVACTVARVADWLEKILGILFSAAINDEYRKQDRISSDCVEQVSRHLLAPHRQD